MKSKRTKRGRPLGSGMNNFHYGKEFASPAAYTRWRKKFCMEFESQNQFDNLKDYLAHWNNMEGTNVPYYMALRWLNRHGISTIETKRRKKFAKYNVTINLHEKAYDIILAYDNISLAKYIQTIIHAVLGFDTANAVVVLVDNLPVFFFMRNNTIHAFTTRNATMRERKMIEAILADAETKPDWRKHVHEWCGRAGFTVLGYNPDNPLQVYKDEETT